MTKRMMRLLVPLVVLVGLVACQSTPAAGPGEPSPTAAAATATPEPAATPTAGPAPTPTVEWQIPQIREEDWVEGSADAGLVIVEYSDFQ
jgi:hypothetical protein